jgi:hypothetical protein
MKSEPKFTPPPWIRKGALIIANENISDVICRMPSDGRFKMPLEVGSKNLTDDANANLIEASPKLYRALEKLLDSFDRLSMGFPLPYEENKIRKEMAQIALAEARGE